MAAATFGRQGIVVDSLGQAHETLRPQLGPLAATAFAVALLASGLASSTAGSLAGQLVLDGLLGWRVPAVARRAVTMVPAIVVLAVGVNEVAALVWSQVARSLALPAVAIPLVALTSRPQVMGPWPTGPRCGGWPRPRSTCWSSSTWSCWPACSPEAGV
jgi:manganese transport protein